MGSLKINSPVFENMDFIPEKYSYDYGNVIPPIKIQGVPAEAKSLILIVDDKDNFEENHFIVFNIPANTKIIEEGNIPYDAVIGRNDFGLSDYIGPLAENRMHRYEFKIYAIDKLLKLGNGLTRDELMHEIKENIIDECSIVGLFKK